MPDLLHPPRFRYRLLLARGFFAFGAAVMLFVTAACKGSSTPVSPVDPPSAPRVLSVFPTGSAGFVGATVQLSAEVEGSTTRWEWRLPELGPPFLSQVARPVIVLPEPGLYEASVSACNDGGCSDPYPFSISVIGEARWTQYQIAEGRFGNPDVALLADGTPAFVCESSGIILWAHARAKVPRQAADWEIHEFGAATSNYDPLLLIKEDLPLVFGGDQVYQTGVTVPETPTDWTSQTAFIPDRPVGVYRGRLVTAGNSQTGEHWSSRVNIATTTGLPQSAAEWVTVQPRFGPGSGGVEVQEERLVAVSGDEQHELHIAYTTADTPVNAADWIDIALPLQEIIAGIAIHQGRIHVMHVKPDYTHLGPFGSPVFYDMTLTQALSTQPKTAADFRHARVSRKWAGGLTFVGGLPAVVEVFIGGGASRTDTGYHEAHLNLGLTSTPVDGNDWLFQQVSGGSGRTYDFTARLLPLDVPDQAPAMAVISNPSSVLFNKTFLSINLMETDAGD